MLQFSTSSAAFNQTRDRIQLVGANERNHGGGEQHAPQPRSPYWRWINMSIALAALATSIVAIVLQTQRDSSDERRQAARDSFNESYQIAKFIVDVSAPYYPIHTAEANRHVQMAIKELSGPNGAAYAKNLVESDHPQYVEVACDVRRRLSFYEEQSIIREKLVDERAKAIMDELHSNPAKYYFNSLKPFVDAFRQSHVPDTKTAWVPLERWAMESTKR